MIKVTELRGIRKAAYIAENVNNLHILEVGPSGSGKSVAGSILEKNAASEGAAVIGISMNQAITPPTGGTNVRVIYVKEQGLPISVLSDIPVHAKDRRSSNELVADAVDAFCTISNLHVRQKKALGEAVKRAMQSDIWRQNEFLAIENELLSSKGDVEESVCAHFEQVLQSVCIHLDSSFHLDISGQIVIFELSGYSLDIQKQLTCYILARIWQEARAQNRSGNVPWFIHLDEFQELGIRPDSTLYQILREGRKFKLGTILATQTLEYFSRSERALLLQASSKLFFSPEPHEIPRLLADIGQRGNMAMSRRLSLLQRGQCLAVGKYAVDTSVIEHPLVLDFTQR